MCSGGAIVDMGCHYIKIARNFIGKGNRPVEVKNWRGSPLNDENAALKAYNEVHFLIKEKKMPDGKQTGYFAG